MCRGTDGRSLVKLASAEGASLFRPATGAEFATLPFSTSPKGTPMALNLPDRFPRHPLMFGPSPVHRLERLSRELGLDVWAKRDDVSSGLAFGGNKIRKLEWLAA